MPRTYRDDMNDIVAVFPQIGPNECDALLWRSIVDICNENDLSFMIAEAKIITAAPYRTGTVAVTNGMAGVTLTGGTWDVAWTGRRIQIKGQNEVYGLTINTTTTGTLDATWAGATDSGLTYLVFRDVYAVPADCELSKELLLFDTVLRQRVDFVDYAEFRACKRELGVISGIPSEVSRIGLTAAGVPQIEFGPSVPDAEKVYMLDYYRSPVKPTSVNQSLSPAWPEAFSDVRVARALWKFADRHGLSRRFELEEKYRRRIFEMKAKFDGGNEMRRRLRSAASKTSGGFSVFARLGGN